MSLPPDLPAESGWVGREAPDATVLDRLRAHAISAPLVTHLYTADPAAHEFEGALFVYGSHDIDGGVPFNDEGDHFCMDDYHVLRMQAPDQPAVDCGIALTLRDVPWAARQLWAPDAACRDGRYYLYFPARARDGLFRIGVAVADGPAGPFHALPEPMAGTYSIDPAVYVDAGGAYYLYFGGIWGGQLQKYRANRYDATVAEPTPDQPALGPRVARLADDMTSLAEPVREVVILDARGDPLRAGDHARRYFEAPWMHRHAGRYYLSWSTGDTHFICHAIGDSPYGPFVYAGRVLSPVVGWTTHHSICGYSGQPYLFYHDALLSGGITHLRSIKMTRLEYDDAGAIATIHPYGA
ncbi:MAG TPA: glycoside hydrolase family 43 protein [Rhodanobacteraceae bacterium]|nr:glycoside hydrolase family 43 protein [Rhodanobacteraceae bacterium]